MNTPHTRTALSHSIAELTTLSRKDARSERFTDWHKYTLDVLVNLLGPDAPFVVQFKAIDFVPSPETSVEEADAVWRSAKSCASALLTTVRFQPYL